jgi:hypothetical protein
VWCLFCAKSQSYIYAVISLLLMWVSTFLFILFCKQMLLDVVVVFNKVSEISQSKHSVKLIEGGIEVCRF